MEAIGRLAGGIAHDFKNLLTVILGNSRLAADSLSNDHEASAYLHAVESAEKGRRPSLTSCSPSAGARFCSLRFSM